MSTLPDFLLARIAEDEAAARAALEVDWLWPPMIDDRDVEGPGSVSHRAYFATIEHVKRHGPDRVLAECEAKRRIVEDCGEILTKDVEFNEKFGRAADARGVLRTIAVVYADHPDYREEWRP